MIHVSDSAKKIKIYKGKFFENFFRTFSFNFFGIFYIFFFEIKKKFNENVSLEF